MHIVPRRKIAGLVVADTGVDDDFLTFGFDHESLDGQVHRAIGGREMRLQPGHCLNLRRRQALQDKVGRGAPQFHFHNLADLDIANAPRGRMLFHGHSQFVLLSSPVRPGGGPRRVRLCGS